MTTLPSTRLAELQDLILSRTDHTDTEAAALYHGITGYEPLIIGTAPSNLHVRFYMIRAGLQHIRGIHIGTSMRDHALSIANDLRRNGYWAEGYSYWMYTKAAFDWYMKVGGVLDDSVTKGVYFTTKNYHLLVAPDGTIPLPETRAEVLPHNPVDLPDVIMDDSYVVKRWFNNDRSRVTGYLLIALDCDPEPRGNLHHRLEAGYMALWCVTGYDVDDKVPDPRTFQGADGNIWAMGPKAIPRYGWATRCSPYTGFSWGAVWDEAGLLSLLPRGALTPMWRLKPPIVTVEHGDESVTIRWKYPWRPAITRTISWSGNTVRVTDRWSIFGHSVKEWRV